MVQKFGKNYMVWQKGILVEVEHVKADRTKKAKKEMSHFEKFVTEGNEKADDLPKAGRRIYGRSESRNYAAGKRGVCSIAVCGPLPLRGRTME